MEPTSESTALEGAGQFYEYAAAGKLKDCKALIHRGRVSSTQDCTTPQISQPV